MLARISHANQLENFHRVKSVVTVSSVQCWAQKVEVKLPTPPWCMMCEGWERPWAFCNAGSRCRGRGGAQRSCRIQFHQGENGDFFFRTDSDWDFFKRSLLWWDGPEIFDPWSLTLFFHACTHTREDKVWLTDSLMRVIIARLKRCVSPNRTSGTFIYHLSQLFSWFTFIWPNKKC